MTRKPVSFIATTQPEAACAFYENVLGLQLVETSPYALVFRDGDATLRVQIVTALQPAMHTVHGWQVVDIASELEGLDASGVQVLWFDQLDQDPRGIWRTPDGHQIAWFKDPCGNVLSFTQFA